MCSSKRDHKQLIFSFSWLKRFYLENTNSEALASYIFSSMMLAYFQKTPGVEYFSENILVYKAVFEL